MELKERVGNNIGCGLENRLFQEFGRGKEPGLQQVNVKFLVSVQELETGGKEKYIIGGLQRIEDRETRNICA